jgi:hypothetical protein
MELLNYFINNYNLYIFCYFFIANFFIYTIYEPFKQKIILAYPKFKTYDQSRQNYIIKNLMKAMALYFISILSIPVIPAFLFNYQKFNIIIQLTGVFYAANDFVGLLKVKKLSFSTKIHHIVSTSLGLSVPMIDFFSSSTARLLMIYTLASCYTYKVNYYLGYRFINENEDLKMIKKKAFNIYLLSFACNLSFQYYWLYIHFYDLSIYNIIYYCIITPLIYDDFKLLYWLYKPAYQKEEKIH